MIICTSNRCSGKERLESPHQCNCNRGKKEKKLRFEKKNVAKHVEKGSKCGWRIKESKSDLAALLWTSIMFHLSTCDRQKFRHNQDWENCTSTLYTCLSRPHLLFEVVQPIQFARLWVKQLVFVLILAQLSSFKASNWSPGFIFTNHLNSYKEVKESGLLCLNEEVMVFCWVPCPSWIWKIWKIKYNMCIHKVHNSVLCNPPTLSWKKKQKILHFLGDETLKTLIHPKAVGSPAVAMLVNKSLQKSF